MTQDCWEKQHLSLGEQKILSNCWTENRKKPTDYRLLKVKWQTYLHRHISESTTTPFLPIQSVDGKYGKLDLSDIVSANVICIILYFSSINCAIIKRWKATSLRMRMRVQNIYNFEKKFSDSQGRPFNSYSRSIQPLQKYKITIYLWSNPYKNTR